MFGCLLLRRRAFLVLPIICISLLGVATILPTDLVKLPADPVDREGSLAAFDAAGAIDGNVPDRPVIWWDLKDPNQKLFSSVGAMYLQQTPRTSKPGDRAVFLRSSGMPETTERALLASQHLVLASPIKQHVGHGSVAFDVTVGNVVHGALP